MALVGERLPDKHEDLNLNPSTGEKKKVDTLKLIGF
jgi:hypothetical protein